MLRHLVFTPPSSIPFPHHLPVSSPTMASTPSGSQKRSLAQATEDENEATTRVYGRWQQNPTQRQQQMGM